VTTLFDVLPPWPVLCGAINEASSVLLCAPRHYGKRRLLAHAADKLRQLGARYACINVELNSTSNSIDFGRVGHMLRRLDRSIDSKVKDVMSFSDAMEHMLAGRSDTTFILVRGTTYSKPAAHYELLRVLDILLEKSAGHLAVLATDDYSLQAYTAHGQLSPIKLMAPYIYMALNESEIARCVERTWPRMASRVRARWSKQLLATTGGHPGLVEDALLHLPKPANERYPTNAADLMGEACSRSHVLAELQESLSEDAKSLCETAVTYNIERFAGSGSRRFQCLRELGVIHRVIGNRWILCPGAIASMVRSMAEQGTSDRRARRLYVPAAVPSLRSEPDYRDIEPDDFVVVHLSDLHFGEHYRFGLTWPGGVINKGAPSAGQMLRADLERLGVCGRCDGIVMTGDFTFLGTPDEVKRAVDVVSEITRAAEVKLARTLIVPGNHDVHWNPGKFEEQEAGRAASLEYFNMFLELLGKAHFADAAVLTFRRRGRALRIIGLNSTEVSGPEAQKVGYVSRQGLDCGAALLGQSAKKRHDGAFTWLAMHHHIFPVTSVTRDEAEQNQASVTANASEVLQCANKWQAELVLHGHEHQPSITFARRWPVDDGHAFEPVAALCAGSFGLKPDKLGPVGRNHYYVIVRKPERIVVRSRWLGDEGVAFTSHACVELPVRGVCTANTAGQSIPASDRARNTRLVPGRRSKKQKAGKGE
jgi:3',5'-cyclic AMP phosphodiesterase CpdA